MAFRVFDCAESTKVRIWKPEAAPQEKNIYQIVERASAESPRDSYHSMNAAALALKILSCRQIPEALPQAPRFRVFGAWRAVSS